MEKLLQGDAGLYSTDATTVPPYLQLPAEGAKTPIPYSPQGWELSKAVQSGQVVQKKTGKGLGDIGFTQEQLQLLTSMMGMGGQQSHPPSAGAPSPRNTVGEMRQFATTQAGKEVTAPRASLGQIIYGGRKF